jgi:2-(1,2-epoxy-1,2-dihydrophenyl)acetyl-CoA isomerase
MQVAVNGDARSASSRRATFLFLHTFTSRSGPLTDDRASQTEVSAVEYETIRFERADGICRITLNRPDRLNSFNTQMHAELRDALAIVKSDADARVLLLTGAGRAFCAGQDLSDRAVAPGAEPPDLGASIEKNYRPLVLALRDLPLPVVCAVNGVAAGAGANIALACDIVIAAESASFIQAFCKIGLIPDSGGTFFLPRLIGSARAMGLALLGDKLSAEQAADWGLIWKCVEDSELAATVDALLVHFAKAPTRGLAATKRALHASANAALETQLDLERDLQRELGRSDDYREGVAAFIAKRPPVFTGK